MIVQDVADGRVLMLAWMDEEAWRVTRDTGVVHFHSRARDRLWRKGESSGHELRVREIALDCDADAILVAVGSRRPDVPPEHPQLLRPRRGRRRGRVRAGRSPVDPGNAKSSDSTTLRRPWTPPAKASPGSNGSGRRSRPARPSGPTTPTRPACSTAASTWSGRKVTEEATEVLIAAKDDATAEAGGTDRDATAHALAGETADLLYHALVLLAERDVRPAEVIEVLRARHAG